MIIDSILASGSQWNLIASTLASYGINFVAIDEGSSGGLLYPSNVTSYSDYNCSTAAINAFHQYGIQVYCDLSVMTVLPQSALTHNGQYVGDVYWNGSALVNDTGQIDFCTLDPTNPYALAWEKQIVQEAVTSYNFDGFMYDYIYYDSEYEPLSTDAQNMFVSMTGLDANASYTQWVNDVLPKSAGGDGLYNTQFMEWRVQVLDNFVSDLSTYIHQARANVTIAATAWDWADIPGVYPYYWRYVLGLDTVEWALDGSVQMLCPMMYSTKGGNFTSGVQGWEQYGIGGAHGDVPLVPLVWSNNCEGSASISVNVTVANFTTTAESILNAGADGICILTYGGPGATNDGVADIRPYLSAIGWPNPPTFTAENFIVTNNNSTSVSVSWGTTLPSTSLVEYSSLPLFNASMAGTAPYDYVLVTHVPGTIISSSANVTSHTITITGMSSSTLYYYRVQSSDPSGTMTYGVTTFTTS
jgi:hypothetical protein